MIFVKFYKEVVTHLLWGPPTSCQEFPLCIRFTIPWSVRREHITELASQNTSIQVPTHIVLQQWPTGQVLHSCHTGQQFKRNATDGQVQQQFNKHSGRLTTWTEQCLITYRQLTVGWPKSHSRQQTLPLHLLLHIRLHSLVILNCQGTEPMSTFDVLANHFKRIHKKICICKLYQRVALF